MLSSAAHSVNGFLRLQLHKISGFHRGRDPVWFSALRHGVSSSAEFHWRSGRKVCSFFLFSWTDIFYLLIVSVESYCCALSHSVTHTHTRWDSSGRGIGPSQRPLPDNTQHLQETDIHAPGGIRTRNPSKRAAADLRLRPLGHRDRRRYVPSKCLQNSTRLQGVF